MPTPTINSGFDLRQLIARGERVFPSYPHVARYFPAAPIEEARLRLSRTIDRGDGPGIVVGGPGTGKSLLLQVLAAQYHERFDVVLLACARICTRRALLQAILFELGLPYRLRDEGRLRLSLLDHLLSADESPAGLLLLVDEAQSLSAALLDELRVMTNLVRGGAPRVRVVLAGSAALEDSFALPELESFSQRLSARCYLAPLSRDETLQFIRAQVAAAGGAPDLIFADSAASAVFDATDGIPRLVCQLCDRALLLADETKRASIDRDTIQAAWADLQQLPTPWDIPSQRSAPAPPTSIVEFGDLSDIETASPQPIADDIEPTELDEEEAAPALKEPVIAIHRQRQGPLPENPFAEEFDEEEVVLDGFAAWDNMFHRATPRVANKRDPDFASLVQAAIDASPVDQPPAALDVDVVVEEIADEEAAEEGTEESSPAELLPDWPPLRLAVVADPPPLKPIPLIEPTGATGPGAAAFDPVFPHDGEDARSWPTGITAGLAPVPRSAKGAEMAASSARREAQPILVIEDDVPPAPATRSPVRREEYRHLFSRLRSG